MVEEQIRDRGLSSPRLLEVMLAVPRHEFVPVEYRSVAYTDQPLPIGEGQTISQPYVVAAMTDAAELAGPTASGGRVLEIGTGSGYQAAVLSLLATEVYTVETCATLAAVAQERLTRLGYTNVRVATGDGTLGWPDAAPFDAIVVTAAAPAIPPPLVEQLAEGGRLVIPVGEAQHQKLIQLRKSADGNAEQLICYCRFVPLRGRHGWPETLADDPFRS